jgi:hypothetical protein
MPTLQSQCTDGSLVTVIYPAEKPAGHSASVRFRVGKKTVLPAYTAANFPHLVQFQHGQRIIMFMLSDILQTSFWHRIRNAYTLRGQLDIDADVKVSAEEAARVADWLRRQSRGIIPDGSGFSEPAHQLASETL